MQKKLFTNKELSELLGISEDDFHRKTKKIIKRDFKTELKNLGFNNPDILLDQNNRMYLADPRDHRIFYTTNLDIFTYI